MKKILALIKGKWQSIAIGAGVIIIVGLIAKISGDKVIITAYENQDEQTKAIEIENKNLKKVIKAASKVVEKFKVLANKECDCEPKLVERITYIRPEETIHDTGRLEKKEESKSKTVLPKQSKPLGIHVGYANIEECFYGKVDLTLGMLSVHYSYDFIFDGRNHSRFGLGFKFLL